MSEWHDVSLGELVEKAGGTIRTGPFGSQLHAHEYVDDPRGVPVVMPKDMVGGRVNRRSVSRVSEETAKRLVAHRLAPGDLVLARRGDVGRFAYIEQDEAGWLCGTGSMRVHAPDRTVVWPLYLRHAIADPAVADWLVGRAVGATMPNLNDGIVAALPVRLPDLQSQRRIAAVLGAFDELIEINGRRIEVLETLARSLYREWFVRFRFPGHADAVLVASDIGQVPEGWDVAPVAALGSYLNGYAFKPSDWADEGLPIIKIKELKQGVTKATPRYRGALLPDKFIVDPGDLLFSWSADLGVYLWADGQGFLNQHLFKVAPLPPVTREFLFHALQESLPDFRARAQGTTMRHIKRSALAEVGVVLPPPGVIRDFTVAVSPLHAQSLALRRTVIALSAARDLVLPRLVTGRLDISDIGLGALTTEATAS